MQNVYLFLILFLTFFQIVAQNPNEEDEKLSEKDKNEIEFLLECSDEAYYKGEYAKSLEYNVKLLNKAQEVNSHKYISRAYGFLGYDYLELGDTALARENFRKQRKYALLTDDKNAIANSYMSLANFYGSVMKDWESSWRNHKKSIELYETYGDSVQIAFSHYNTALSAIRNDQYEIAKQELDFLKDYSKYQNPSNRLYTNILWGKYYIFKKEYEKANIYFLKIIDNKEQDEEYIVELYTAYDLYSQSLFLQEKYKQAYHMRKKHEEYYYKNVEEWIASKSQEVTAQYQVSEYKRDAEDAMLNKELQTEVAENKSKANRILIIGIISVIFLLIILFFLLKQKTELVASLKEKNKKYLEAKRVSENLLKAKRKFFSTVSHELRTPLYGVIGLTGILLEDKSLTKHESDLKSLKFSADYLLALINDVLQLNKIESKSVEEEKINFNLYDLVNTIANSFKYMSQQNNNDIQIHIDEEIPNIIKGNSVRLSQVLMNLVGNASKFTKNGRINIIAENMKLSENEVCILFKVKDTGIGIAKDQQATIFNEFSQANAMNYNYQGSGLGLSIVKKLLKLSNSEINLKSEIGEGTEFSFELSYEIDEKQIRMKNEARVDETTLENKEVLVVDDNKINQMITARILERNKMKCTIVENGLSAIEIIKQKYFDFILMDINMPGIDGFKTTERIREYNKTVPIIALTAVDVEEVSGKVHECGMNDIITKPYDVTKFIKTIIENINGQDLNKKGVI